MPKYFDGKKKLPFTRILVTSDVLTEDWLRGELERLKGEISLCVRFPGFPATLLGYVFNIQQTSDGAFRLRDITGKALTSVKTIAELLVLIRHVSGEAYDAKWRGEFQRLRNEISSKTEAF